MFNVWDFWRGLCVKLQASARWRSECAGCVRTGERTRPAPVKVKAGNSRESCRQDQQQKNAGYVVTDASPPSPDPRAHVSNTRRERKDGRVACDAAIGVRKDRHAEIGGVCVLI